MKETKNPVYGTVKEAVDRAFDELPFSNDNEEEKETILSYSIGRYDKDLCGGKNASEAAGNLLIHARSVDSISGYLKVQAPKKVDEAEVLSESVFLKTQKKLRNYVYLLSFLLALGINSVLSFILNLSFIGLGIAVAEWAVIGVLVYFITKKQKKIVAENDFFASAFDKSCRKTAVKKYDFYTKKLTNTLFCVFSLVFIVLFSVILSVITYKYSYAEVVDTLNFYLIAVLLVVYLAIKNYLCRRMYAEFFPKLQRKQYSREIGRISLFSAVYYAAALTVLLLLRNKTNNIFTFAIVIMAVYFVAAVVYNFTRRREFTTVNVSLNARKVVCYTLIFAVFLTFNFMKLDTYMLQPYINTVSPVEHAQSTVSYNEDTGVYTLTTDSDNFKVLQLTDIHIGGGVFSVSKDTKALKACYSLISETKPDFVVVTGDLVFPMGIMSLSFNNNAPIMQFANFMRNVGIPWAFTYGNHDTESLATLGRTEIDDLMKSLSYKTSANFLYPYVQPDIYGRSNQMIEIRHSDGELMQALFLIDSNDYIEGGKINEYDYIHDDQVEWYKRTVNSITQKEGRTVPSMIFTHIPLQEYKVANNLYESGSDEVEYFYGILGEEMIDKICCSKYPSKLFETAVELGSTQAIFCGHDHYNNQSVEYKGIRLTYGYSIDYLAMPGIENDIEQRGATLITIDKNGGYEITPYRLMDLN